MGDYPHIQPVGALGRRSVCSVRSHPTARLVPFVVIRSFVAIFMALRKQLIVTQINNFRMVGNTTLARARAVPPLWLTLFRALSPSWPGLMDPANAFDLNSIRQEVGEGGRIVVGVEGGADYA